MGKKATFTVDTPTTIRAALETGWILPTSNRSVRQPHNRRSSMCLSPGAELREMDHCSQADYHGRRARSFDISQRSFGLYRLSIYPLSSSSLIKRLSTK